MAAAGSAGGSGAAATENSPCPVDAHEELLGECESIWKKMEECQSKLALLRPEKTLKSGDKLSMLMMQARALTAEHNEWQQRSPEIISENLDVLLALGKEELQKVQKDLEMVLSTIQSRNEKLDEDLKREQQWHEEQKLVLDALNEIEKEKSNEAKKLSRTSLNSRALHELQHQEKKLNMYKKELLNALGEFLEEHFPLPDKSRRTKNSKNSGEPAVELITLHEILEILVNKLMRTPHDPFVAIEDSFWPPYIELLLRCGIALRHPEDPNRIRLEAFHI
ncbi:centromere protein K [Calypte anna]|uniref:centromere protein K n=1 Tax=Calypte anna TaxID=9244 RepID=UPI0011C3CA52|nr:centromere protein K [Calypte anna]